MELNNPMHDIINIIENPVFRFAIRVQSFIHFYSANQQNSQQLQGLQQKIEHLNIMQKKGAGLSNPNILKNELSSIYETIDAIREKLVSIFSTNEIMQERNKLIIESMHLQSLVKENLIKLQKQ